MNRVILVGFLFLFLVNPDATTGGNATANMALQGKWKAVQSDPPGPVPDATIQFQGNTFKIVFDGQEQHSGTVRLDPGKSPKHLDLQVEKSQKSYGGKLLLGIYEVKGDKLTICLNETDNGGRPTSFNGKDLMAMYVVHFERIKP